MSRKFPASSKKPEKSASVDLFADLTISGNRVGSAERSSERSQSAGKSSSKTAESGPVPPISVPDSSDLMEMDLSLPSPIAEEDGEVIAMQVSDDDLWFDNVIGHIEDLIMDDDFQDLQTSFFDKYCSEFDDSDENKLIYTDIHHAYVETIERFLETRLRQRLDSFVMVDFIREVEQRWRSCQTEEERFVLGLDGEVFEILQSFGDFLCFKELMLDHKKSKQGSLPDFSAGLHVLNINTPR